MKKQTEKLKTVSEEWPELDIIADILKNITIRELNKIVPHAESDCPYPAQCTLELLISKLEECV